MYNAIPIEIKIIIAIFIFVIKQCMQMIGDLYGIGVLTNWWIVCKFISTMKEIKLQKYIKWPSSTMMKIYVDEFESIHNISYVVSAIHESHIPIIAQKLHAIYYQNKKWFHYILCKVL